MYILSGRLLLQEAACRLWSACVLTFSKLLRLQDAAGAKACFVDCSVYSRNRAFRLYLSSKAGKQAILQPTGDRSGHFCKQCNVDKTQLWVDKHCRPDHLCFDIRWIASIALSDV